LSFALNSIYLDNNSTTRIFDEVIDEMAACYRHGYLNPASQHSSGREARRVLESARESIGTMLGASFAAPSVDRLIFTSGGTESNNLAIRGLVSAPGNVIVSSIEHPSVLEPAEQLKSAGIEIRNLPVSRSGHVSVERLETAIDDETRLVCVMFANNEIGTLQPIGEIGTLCRERKVPFHCDAVQVVGKMAIDFRELGMTTLAFSAHKFHGPRGVGGLLLRHGVNMQPFMVGGSQQLGLRPGTESIANVVGMHKALEMMLERSTSWSEEMSKLRNRLESKLVSQCECMVIGAEPRMPHTTNLAFPGLDRQALVMSLDLAGVECSTGSACTSGSSEPSHVIVATGVEKSLVEGSIRVSLGVDSIDSDIDLVAERILSVANNLRSLK